MIGSDRIPGTPRDACEARRLSPERRIPTGRGEVVNSSVRDRPAPSGRFAIAVANPSSDRYSEWYKNQTVRSGEWSRKHHVTKGACTGFCRSNRQAYVLFRTFLRIPALPGMEQTGSKTRLGHADPVFRDADHGEPSRTPRAQDLSSRAKVKPETCGGDKARSDRP